MAQDNMRWARVLGVVALVAGVAGAIVMWWAAGHRYDDAVADLAPAPAGCDTTLVFDRAGSYTFFLESKGELDPLDGDCVRDAEQYELDEPPRVQLSMVDDTGEEVDLDRADGPSYDRGGSAGDGFRTVDIDQTGTYVLTVESDNSDVVVRVGGDPSDGVIALRLGAIAVLLAGVGAGVLGLVAGRSRPVAPARPLAVESWPQFPATPPIAPPTIGGGPAPPYSPPPSGRPLPPPTIAVQAPARDPEPRRPLPPPRPLGG